jgi:predicted AAA+ superfamily ATPase
VDQLLTRDSEQLNEDRDPVRLRRYLEAFAVNTAGVVDHKSIYDAAGINKKTAEAYDRLLANLLVVESLPAWTTNRLKRLVLMPKRYVLDGALALAVLGLNVDGLLRSGDLLGRLLDTFVASQLRAELAFAATRPRLYHVRQQQGRLAVDLLAEFAAGRVIAFEVKATGAPTASDARHLMTVRDLLGTSFVAGVVFHTGPRVFEIEDRILAVPISALWA